MYQIPAKARRVIDEAFADTISGVLKLTDVETPEEAATALRTAAYKLEEISDSLLEAAAIIQRDS